MILSNSFKYNENKNLDFIQTAMIRERPCNGCTGRKLSTKRTRCLCLVRVVISRNLASYNR